MLLLFSLCVHVTMMKELLLPYRLYTHTHRDRERDNKKDSARRIINAVPPSPRLAQRVPHANGQPLLFFCFSRRVYCVTNSRFSLAASFYVHSRFSFCLSGCCCRTWKKKRIQLPLFNISLIANNTPKWRDEDNENGGIEPSSFLNITRLLFNYKYIYFFKVFC